MMKSSWNWNPVSRSVSLANPASQPYKNTKSRSHEQLRFPLPTPFLAQIRISPRRKSQIPHPAKPIGDPPCSCLQQNCPNRFRSLEMHLEIFETCFEIFLIFTPIIPDPLLPTTFTHKALGSLFNWTRFLELERNFGTRCLLHDFKRKIKRVLFNILSSEDSYLDKRNVIQKVKFS